LESDNWYLFGAGMAGIILNILVAAAVVVNTKPTPSHSRRLATYSIFF
jgi:hypothetical protein